MTDDKKSILKKHFKMIKKYYKYGYTISQLNELRVKFDECTALILDVQGKYARCMSKELNNQLAAP